MERPQVKAIAGLLTKAAGLVFFAFLAISLGVVFGYLFEDWVKEQPGAAVQAPAAGAEDFPATVEDTAASEPHHEKSTAKTAVPGGKAPTIVRYKVRVGPFATRDAALKTAKQLETAGYPVYVSAAPPYTIQVGAFASRANADHLKGELTGKGFTAFVKQE